MEKQGGTRGGRHGWRLAEAGGQDGALYTEPWVLLDSCWSPSAVRQESNWSPPGVHQEFTAIFMNMRNCVFDIFCAPQQYHIGSDISAKLREVASSSPSCVNIGFGYNI